MSIDQNRLQLAEDRAINHADSLYPLAEESEVVLLAKGQHISREYGFMGEESALFADAYVRLYTAEIDCIDQDYESV